MADEIKLKAPTVEQQVVVNINGEDKLKSFADTLDKISNNKNLQKYWKTQQDLINATADAYGNFQKKASKDNASELIKITNALKAMSGTDLSHILPDFDKISKGMAEAQKVAGNIDSAFSVKGFKEAFDSFETLKAYGTDIQKLFSHFGVSSDIGELQRNVRLLESEVEKLTRKLSNARNANEELRNEFENFKVGSGFADKLNELDRLKAEMQNIRDEATQTFNQFLDVNKIDRYDWFDDDDRFAEYFKKLENGTLTASEAIRQFKTKYDYLLEESFKSNGNSFGLDQLQAFSKKLDSIFQQVEETSNKINDILSNGVIAKSVQNLSEDTTLSDSQRSIFGNILQDEESLKSITALFQKLIDETNQTKNTEVFNTEQFTKIESLFTSIESSLSSIKGVLVDVGDGEELSPLLKTIANIESAIDNLSSSVKGIGLNMNIDFGSDSEMEAKAQAKISNALQAYQNLFDHIKMSSAGGSLITQKFFDFDINQFDTPMSKLQAYIKFIKDMREETKKMFGGQDILKIDTDDKYWNRASAAMGQVKKTFNEMKATNDTNPLENIFGKTDLTEVISQLENIVSKLDEISVSAKGFTETFKNGLNVNASVEEIEKLTNRVKELEDELAKVKAPTILPSNESNISLASNSEVKATTNDITEEQKAIGELQIAFRGLEGSLNGFMSNSGRLATFFTTSPLLARQYADSLGGVYQAMVALGNSLNINAEGRDWNAVEYLGNGSDEASKKIIELRKQIDSLYEQLNASGVSGTGLDGRAEQIRGDFSHIIQFYGDAGIEYNSYIEAVEKGNIIENQENETVKNLMVQLYNLEKAYRAISDARDNVYGTHTTDEFAELAKANGYDSVMFRNIKDSFDRTKNLTDVGVIFDENQVANVKNVSDQIDNLVSRIDGVKSQHGLNLPINIELPKEISKLEDGSFVNNLTGEIYSNAQTAIESLKELETQAIETEKVVENISSQTPKKDAFPNADTKLDEAVTSAKDLDNTLNQVDIPIDSFDKVLEKLDRTKSELVDIVKITKQSISDADGKFHDSYTLKDSRGSTEIYGMNSKTDKGQILRQNIVGYNVKKDTVDNSKELLAIEKQLQKEIEASDKANQKKFQDFQKEQVDYVESVNKVNSAIQKTDEILDTLPLHDKLDSQFLDMIDSVDKLNSKLKSGELTLSEYKNEVKSVTSEYSKMVSIQQKRDVEDYNANARANLDNTKNIQAEWDKNLKAIQDYMDAVTKLNNLKASDKGLGTRTADIEAQQKKIDDMKSSFESAQTTLLSFFSSTDKFNSLPVSSIKEVQDAIKLIQTAANGSAESVSRLEDALRNMQETSIGKLEKTLSNYRGKVSGYEALIKKFGDDGWTSPEYLDNVQRAQEVLNLYQEAINKLKANPDLINKKSLADVEKLGKDFEEVTLAIKNMTAAQKGYTQLGAEKAMDKISQMLKENSKMSRQAKADIKAWYEQIASGNPSVSLDIILGKVEAIVRAEKEAGRGGKSMWDAIKEKAWYGVANTIGTYFGLNDIIRYGKEGIDTIRELDAAMTEVRKVSNATEAQYKSFQKTISSTAKEIATTNKELLNSSADFLRLGYSLDQASDLAKNATLFVNVGDGVDITEATEDMITAMKAFDIQAEDSIKIVDDYNQIGNKFALSATDIGEAMKRSASALETGNNSFEESIALITAMNEIVQNSENTGNTLKVFSLRLRGAKAELEDMGEDTDGLCESTSKLREQLKSLTGVDIMLNDNTFKSTTQIVKELGATWDKLSDSSQAATLELVAGKTRANNVAALLKNYQKIDDVMESLGDAEGSAMRENEAIVDSIDGRIKKLSASMEDFWQKFINTNLVKDTVSSLGGVLNLLTKIIDKVGLLPTLLTPISAIIGKKLGYASI